MAAPSSVNVDARKGVSARFESREEIRRAEREMARELMRPTRRETPWEERPCSGLPWR